MAESIDRRTSLASLVRGAGCYDRLKRVIDHTKCTDKLTYVFPKIGIYSISLAYCSLKGNYDKYMYKEISNRVKQNK